MNISQIDYFLKVLVENWLNFVSDDEKLAPHLTMVVLLLAVMLAVATSCSSMVSQEAQRGATWTKQLKQLRC